jgi:gluconolactonase
MDRYEGKRINRPNDVVCKSDGSIWFTDPGLRVPLADKELAHSGIYAVEPDGASRLVAEFEYPNGLAFSPDERVLYVANTRHAQYIHAIELDTAGNLVRRRIFADMSSEETDGVPDGMKVDVEGNVYCGGAGGIWILDPSGKKLGRIVHGQPATTNMAFGGDDWKTLYFTSRTHLGAVNVKIPGVPVPVPKKTTG